MQPINKPPAGDQSKKPQAPHPATPGPTTMKSPRGSLRRRAARGAHAGLTPKAIVRTALEHHLVSRHTSRVAIDKTPVRRAGGPLNSEQIANLMPYGQSTSAILGFPSTATDAGGLRMTGIGALLAALTLLMTPRLCLRIHNASLR